MSGRSGAPFTVALVGADGAGKSTISRALPERLDSPSRVMYLGVNLEEKAPMLPTTRLFLKWKGRSARPDLVLPVTAARKEAKATLRGLARTLVVISEEWYRLLVSRRWLRDGVSVIFDRHFVADYYYHHIEASRPLPWYERLHGRLLRRYPAPDHTFCLDAPAEVLYERKPESDVGFLEQRRMEYVRLAENDPTVRMIDTTRGTEAVLEAIATDLNRVSSKGTVA